MNASRVFRTARRWAVAVGKRAPALLDLAREAVIVYRGAAYRRLCRRVNVERDTVLFQSFGGRGYSCSPRAIYLAMREDARCARYQYIWTLRADIAAALAERGFDVDGLEPGGDRDECVDLDRDFAPEALEELRDARIVVYDSPAHYRELARSDVWVTNSLLPDHVHPRETQTYVQAWHGTPLKRIGNDIKSDNNALYRVGAVHRRYRREGERSTILLAPSSFARDAFVSAFDLARSGRQDIVKVTGYPRNDVLATLTPARVEALRTRLGVPSGKRVVLYAPTWRDDEHSGEAFVDRGRVDFAALHEALGDDYVVLFRAHYLTAASIDFEQHGSFLHDASRVNDVNDLYAASDVLVTDYSSVFFDYANLSRPMVFHMYDLDHYSEEIRGFYLDIAEMPGAVTRTDAQLAEAVHRADEWAQGHVHELHGFRARYCPLDDGHAAVRALDHILARFDYRAAPKGSQDEVQ